MGRRRANIRIEGKMQMRFLGLTVCERMFISSSLFPAAYDHIVSSSRGSTNARTFILVSPDVDAISGARLLHDMLSVDMVPNTVIPVASWSELEKVQDRLATEQVGPPLPSPLQPNSHRPHDTGNASHRVKHSTFRRY